MHYLVNKVCSNEFMTDFILEPAHAYFVLLCSPSLKMYAKIGLFHLMRKKSLFHFKHSIEIVYEWVEQDVTHTPTKMCYWFWN